MSLKKRTERRQLELWKLAQKFVTDQQISCAESVYQTDRVIENAYELIEQMCEIVGYVDDEL